MPLRSLCHESSAVVPLLLLHYVIPGCSVFIPSGCSGLTSVRTKHLISTNTRRCSVKEVERPYYWTINMLFQLSNPQLHCTKRRNPYWFSPADKYILILIFIRILSWASSIVWGIQEIHDVSWGPGSVDGVAGRHALDGSGFGGGTRFSIRHIRRERLWGSPNLQFNIYLVSFPGLNQPERGVYHPPPSSAEVKNEHGYTCTPALVPPVAFYGMNFTERFRSWHRFHRQFGVMFIILYLMRLGEIIAVPVDWRWSHDHSLRQRTVPDVGSVQWINRCHKPLGPEW